MLDRVDARGKTLSMKNKDALEAVNLLCARSSCRVWSIHPVNPSTDFLDASPNDAAIFIMNGSMVRMQKLNEDFTSKNPKSS